MTQAATALIPANAQLPAHLAGGVGLGNENIDASMLATPRLILLQALSPQATRGPNYIPGAQAGLFLNSITNELYEELFVANLFLTRYYSVNKKRVFQQKDWRGNFPTADLALAKLQGDGVNPNDYDIQETHGHTLALINPSTGTIISPIQMSMKASALRDSRQWNSNIATQGPNLDRFSSIWKITAKMNSNASGTWFTPQAAFAGWAPENLFVELQNLFEGMRSKAPAVPQDEAEL